MEIRPCILEPSPSGTSRGLTVGAEFDYVVETCWIYRKYVVASELLPSLSEKFGWENADVLATYQGKELNHIVTEHPWDTEVDELVILGEHVTPDSGTSSIRLLVLVRMTTMSVIAIWPRSCCYG